VFIRKLPGFIKSAQNPSLLIKLKEIVDDIKELKTINPGFQDEKKKNIRNLRYSNIF
jgi:hypothetical protein